MKLKIIFPLTTIVSIFSLACAAYAVHGQADSNSNLNPFSRINSPKSDKWIPQSVSKLKQRTALSYRVQSYRNELKDEALVMVEQLGNSSIDWDDVTFQYSAASSILTIKFEGKVVGIVGEPKTKLMLEFFGDDLFDFKHIGQLELEIDPCSSEQSNCRRAQQQVTQYLEEQFQVILPEVESKVTVEARRLVNAS